MSLRNIPSVLLLLFLAACGRSTPAPVAYGSEPYERWMYTDSARTGSTSPTLPSRPVVQNGIARHTVQRGETLAVIARKYRTTEQKVAASNRIPFPYRLNQGQSLIVPVTYGNHTVRSGETLYSIARTYQMDLYELAEMNKLPRPFTVAAGQTLRVPRAGNTPAPARVASTPVRTPAPQTPNRWWPWGRGQTTAAAPKVSLPAPPPRSSNRFSWPVIGRVIAGFGSTADGGQQNDGINIAVPQGTPVRAAENGVVAYANDSIRGYGNMVLLKHDGGWITTYAQNSTLEVYQGQRVKRGQVIARSGGKGHVHFEVRSGKRPVNPLAHLEAQRFSGEQVAQR